MIKPFKRVNSLHGAPMGRLADHPSNFIDNPDPLIAFHQEGGDGYDSGGAYWGEPNNVYAVCTLNRDCITYVRASSKQDAITKAGW